MQRLIIITGDLAAGKSTLAASLSQVLGMPFLTTTMTPAAYATPYSAVMRSRWRNCCVPIPSGIADSACHANPVVRAAMCPAP